MTQIKQNVISIESPNSEEQVATKGYCDGYVEDSRLLIDGYSVTHIINGEHTFVSNIGRFGSIRSLPPYVYGDPTVFDDLIASGDPNNASVEPIDVVWIGTSRSSGLVIQTLAQSSAPGLPWGGCQVGYGGLTTSAWAGVWMDPPLRGYVAAFGSYLGHYSPGSALAYTCNGTVAPGGNDTVNRMIYGSFDITGKTHAMTQYVGREVVARAYYMAGPDGITGSHMRLGIRIGSSLSQNYYSSYFSTYNATYELRYVDCIIPSNHNWTTGPALAVEIIYRAGQATINNEVFYFLDYRIICNRGINIHSGARGGAWTEDFVDERMWHRDLYDYYGLQSPGSKQQLWIELGCNGTGLGFRTVAQDFAYKNTIIDRFLEKCPNGKVLLLTSYPTSGNPGGTSTWYREADLQVAASRPNVAVIDTQLAMPTYAAGVALSYYGAVPDGTHYDDVGRAAWDAMIASLANKSAR